MTRSLVEIDTRELNRILKAVAKTRPNAVKNVAFAIERKAKQLAPVDTGALRASIYTRIGRESFDSVAMSKAKAENPGVELVELPEPENDSVAYIGPSVNYAIYVELGTRFMGAQAFLGPAVRMVESELATHFRGVVTGGK